MVLPGDQGFAGRTAAWQVSCQRMSSFECNGRNRKSRSLPWEAISPGRLQKNAGGGFENGASPPHSFWLLQKLLI
jgi:hypothetical protein